MPVLDAVGGDGGGGSAVGDVREALAGLGYGADEIRDAAARAAGDGGDARRCCATPSSCSGPRRA